jgi:hypothetical protein
VRDPESPPRKPAFEADYFGTDEEPVMFPVLAATAGILGDAAQLVATHGLRAYDAVQLASARATRREVPEGQLLPPTMKLARGRCARRLRARSRGRSGRGPFEAIFDSPA